LKLKLGDGRGCRLADVVIVVLRWVVEVRVRVSFRGRLFSWGETGSWAAAAAESEMRMSVTCDQ
jgi:hypothetical protein